MTQQIFLLAALGWLAPSQAQEIEAGVEPDTRSCITTRSIRRIRILDDRSILIYLNSGSVFHNVLQRTCRGLKRLGTFSYTSSDGQLCGGDGIAGANGAWEDVRPSPQCWLGTHQRVTREQADAMREASKRAPKIPPKPLPMPQPSEVGDEDKDSDGDPES